MKFKENLNNMFTEDVSIPLEHRLFLSAILIGLLISVIGSIMAVFLAGSVIPSIVSVIMSLVLFAIYYLGRTKGIVKPFIIPVILASFISVFTIWIFGGGIKGPNLLPAFAILILSLIVVPEKRKKYFMLLFITFVIFVYLIQYYKPDLIVNYPSETSLWIDSLATTIYTSFCIYLIIIFFHRHYTIERLKAEANEIQLVQLNAEKDKLFSIIAHDLRSPFNVLLGYTEVLSKESSEMSTEEIQDATSMLNVSAEKLYELIGNLLEWSKMQRGLISFSPISFLLVPAISETLLLVIEAARIKVIGIEVDIAPDLVAYADKKMFETIIRNLANNAVKFTPKSGRITISARTVSKTQLEISVKDTGIGMSKHLISNLFRLDVKTGREGTAGESSTGLGLIICRDFIQRHNGKLWVESEEGKGSTFFFNIPVEAESGQIV
ncbi:MAG: HAMP domain-containing sensor histidine kinase [Mariniphaga sp.]